MARTYTLKKRAEQQAQTRQRIVDAAVELHSTVGPGQTSLSMVAEKAGVQRHTLYAHFPDERSLLMACSGQHYEQHPPPDAERWRLIADRRERLRTGLSEMYRWYEDNAQITACVMRDAETHPLVKEISTLRMGPRFAAYNEVLGEPLDGKQRAVLQLALSFFSWRSLVRNSGLSQAAAVEVMVQAVESAGV